LIPVRGIRNKHFTIKLRIDKRDQNKMRIETGDSDHGSGN
jgi:hypothetical protein